MKHKSLFFIIILFIGIVFLLFWQFFIHGLFPYPGNFMLAWFEPWKEQFTKNGVITLIHKPIADDIFRQLYPFRILGIRLIKTMQLPLWNPYNGAGMPLLATLNSGFLDPFNFLYFFFPNYLAWTVYILIQPLMVLCATYLYCRSISMNRQAAVFSSIIFTLSGAVIVRFAYGIFGLAYALFPFLLYIIERVIENHKTKKIFFLPITLFAMIVSTQPQITSYIGLFFSCYLIFRLIQERMFHLLVTFVSFTLLGIGLAAIQLFPTIELFHFANLNSGSSLFIFKNFFLPLSHFVTLFIPNYFGSIGTYNYWGFADYIETASYIGTIPLFFAFLSFLYVPKNTFFSKMRWFFLTAGIICILTTLNLPFVRILFSLPIPIVSTGIPSRILIISSFCFSILAGMGMSTILIKKPEKRILYYSIIYTLFILGLLVFTLLQVKMHSPCPPGPIQNCHTISLRNSSFETVIFIFFILVFYLLLSKKRNLFVILSIILVLGLGIYNSNKYQPFSQKESFTPHNELISKLQTLGIQRVFGFDDASIKTNFATFFSFYDPQYYHPLYIRRYGELIGYANQQKFPPQLLRSDVEIINNATINNSSLTKSRQRLFDLLSVRYFIYKNSNMKFSKNTFWANNIWHIDTNATALPHAYAVSSYQNVSTNKKILQILFSDNFSPKNDVILEQKIPFQPNINTPQSKLQMLSYTPNTISIKTMSDKPFILVLTDNYYPGWQAYIDDKMTNIYRANYTFRAILLPKGKHIVHFLYVPESLRIGEILSTTSILTLLFVFFLWPKIRNNKKH